MDPPSAVHHGDFENLVQLHATLLDWVEVNGYRILGPYREIYVKSNRQNGSATEVQYPVAKTS